MLFIIGLQLVMIPAYPYVIAPLFNSYKPLSSFPEYAQVQERVEALAKKLKFPLGRIWVIDGSKRSAHSNAFFYGLPGLSRHIVLYDTLLEGHSPAEIEAVMAHELGHWANTDSLTLLMTGQVTLMLNLSLISLFLFNPALYHAFGFYQPHPTSIVSEASNLIGIQTAPQALPILIGFQLCQGLLSPLDTIIAFIVHAISRRLEFRADAFAKVRGYGPELANGLVKLMAENKAICHSDWLYSAFHHSHPTLPERIARLDLDNEDDKSK